MRAERYRYPSDLPYRFYRRGDTLPMSALVDAYFIYDFLALGLMEPPYGDRWVRFGPDALLVDPRTGQVLDVIYGVYDDGTYAPPPPEAFESGAPPPDLGPPDAGPGLSEQMSSLEARIRHDRDAGGLSADAARDALAGLDSIRDEQTSLRARNGGVLAEADRQYLQTRLTELTRRVRWQEEGGR